MGRISHSARPCGKSFHISNPVCFVWRNPHEEIHRIIEKAPSPPFLASWGKNDNDRTEGGPSDYSEDFCQEALRGVRPRDSYESSRADNDCSWSQWFWEDCVASFYQCNIPW